MTRQTLLKRNIKARKENGYAAHKWAEMILIRTVLSASIFI